MTRLITAAAIFLSACTTEDVLNLPSSTAGATSEHLTSTSSVTASKTEVSSTSHKTESMSTVESSTSDAGASTPVGTTSEESDLAECTGGGEDSTTAGETSSVDTETSAASSSDYPATSDVTTTVDDTTTTVDGTTTTATTADTTTANCHIVRYPACKYWFAWSYVTYWGPDCNETQMILFTVTPDLRKGDLVCVPVDINEPDVLKRKLQNAWPVVSGYDSAGDVWSNVPADDGMGFTCKRLHAYDIDIQIRQGYQFHYYVNGVSISQAEQAALVEEECVWGPG